MDDNSSACTWSPVKPAVQPDLGGKPDCQARTGLSMCKPPKTKKPSEILSTVYIITTLPNNPNLEVGLGTVVSNGHTVVTAGHVYLPEATLVQFIDSYGNSITYSTSQVNRDYRYSNLFGDMVTITLPNDMPGLDVVPAVPASGFDFGQSGGKNVTAVNSSNWQLHTATVQLDASPVVTGTTYHWGVFAAGKNPNGVFKGGDSGGGVFSNGNYVGLNSAIGFGQLLIQPYR